MNATTEIGRPLAGRLSGNLRTRTVLDGGDEPTEPLPRPSTELSPLHGCHRAELDSTTPLADLLAEQWEPHPWAHGRHHQPMRGGAWLVAFGLILAALLLWAVLALNHYYGPSDEAVAPLHGVPAPATTGQTPEPPVAGRGAR